MSMCTAWLMGIPVIGVSQTFFEGRKFSFQDTAGAEHDGGGTLPVPDDSLSAFRQVPHQEIDEQAFAYSCKQ